MGERQKKRGTENIENGRGIAWGLGEAARGCEEAQIRNWERKKGGRKDLSRRVTLRPEEAAASSGLLLKDQGLEADREARNGRNGKE